MSGLALNVHVVAGGIALLAGGAALVLRKGDSLHAKVGTIFFGSMLIMTALGALVAAPIPERGTALIAIFTFYLVSTSWLAARRRDGVARSSEYVSLAVSAACAATFMIFAIIAAGNANGRLDSLPASAHYPFAVVAAIAAAFDLSFILRGRLSGSQRIGRHLWRMCTALLIAAFSFFIGQQKVMPDAIRGSPLLFIPPLAVFATMLFWILRVRFAKAWARGRTRLRNTVTPPAEGGA